MSQAEIFRAKNALDVWK